MVRGECLGTIRGLLGVLKQEVGFGFSLPVCVRRKTTTTVRSLSITRGSSLAGVCCDDRRKIPQFRILKEKLGKFARIWDSSITYYG